MPASFIKTRFLGFRFLGAHVLEMGTFTFMLEAHLRCALCGVCWHFFDIQIHTETKLLSAAGLVAVDIVFEGSLKPEHQQLEVRVVRRHSLLLLLKIRCRRMFGVAVTFLESYRMKLNASIPHEPGQSHLSLSRSTHHIFTQLPRSSWYHTSKWSLRHGEENHG